MDIYRELSAAYTAYYAKEFEVFGRDVGAALALTFIGPGGVAKLDNDDAAALKGMIEAQMYPTLSKGIYNDADNKKYVAYLIYLSDSRANPTETFTKPNVQKETIFAIPATREISADKADPLDPLPGQQLQEEIMGYEA